MNWTIKTYRSPPGAPPVLDVLHIYAPSLTTAIERAAALVNLQTGFSISNLR